MGSLVKGLGTTLLAAAGVYVTVVRPWLIHWGSLESERCRPLPGDDLVPYPRYETTHATTIAAPPDIVWRWVIQLGQGRGGFYSYDWLENALGLEIYSVNQIEQELQSLKVGDVISLAPDEAVPMWVTTLDPPFAMVLSTAEPGSQPVAGDYLKGELAGSWAYVLEQVHPRTTRLVVRWRSNWRDDPVASVLNTIGLEPAHCIMERGMMLGIKQRAERAGVLATA